MIKNHVNNSKRARKVADEKRQRGSAIALIEKKIESTKR
jgi:hypothetical protein